MTKNNKLYFVLMLLVLIACGKGDKKHGTVNVGQESLYYEYISEYTGGVISKKSSIKLRFAKDVDTASFGGNDIISMKPAVKGKFVWDNKRTIVFYPDGDLASGTNYEFRADLAKLFNAPENLAVFTFNVQVKTQNIEVVSDDLALYEENGNKYQKINGYVETADVADNTAVEKIISLAKVQGEPRIVWEHSNGNKHLFTVEGLLRTKDSYVAKINFNGSPIGVDKKGSIDAEVYGLANFKYIGLKVHKNGDQAVDILFSMPLDPKQDLKSSIKVEGDKNPSFGVNGSVLKYYPSSGHADSVKITVYSMLKDISGQVMSADVDVYAAFKQEKPLVRWAVKQGGIMPSSNGFVVPFEAVSLKAVDITVVEIFEDNFIQFLQVNQGINGDHEIRRVGRPVIYKTISLENQGVGNLYKWNRFNLKLDDLISAKPGSVYQVRINFRKSQSLYTDDSVSESSVAEEDEFRKEAWDYDSESSYWDYYYDDDYGDWNNRDNPMSMAYYGKKREVRLNLLASDIGLIAKRSETGVLQVIATDIVSSAPLSGIDLDVYNYQSQIITKGKTDNVGMARFDLDEIPFAVVAKRGKERSYLRVDDGTSLSVSSFDTGGVHANKGLKGFVYGERGVWRPGDTVYLYFMLEDKEHILPADHPVILELTDPKGQLAKRIVVKENVGGIYNFTFTTDFDAPTGNWMATVRAGGETFTKRVKIEAIKPNRLKVDLSFGKEYLSVMDTVINGQLKVAWLHGAPGKYLKAAYTLGFVPMSTEFKGFPGYSFDDESKEFSYEENEIFTGTTDENGNASVSMQMPHSLDAPGALKAVFNGKVFEEGGDFSVDRLVVPYYPYKSFVGVKMPSGDKTRGMLLTDTDHMVNIATVNADGTPVARNNVEIDVYKMSWRWWWDQSDNTPNYLGRSLEDRYQHAIVSTDSKGNAVWKLKIAYPEWGRFYIRVKDPVSGHSSGKVFYVDWPGWAGSAQRGELGGATMLSFFADKEEYKTGEQVKVTIPVSAKGHALVSLESGNAIIDTFWVETNEGKTEFTFNTKPEMAPNVYIHITMLQPHKEVKNDLPIRLYGIVPIKVFDPATKLEPVVEVKDTLLPESEVKITVSEKNKKPMAYTVMVVDEGLLDLTNFRTPDPWNSFYARDALGIRSWDLYDEVMGAYAQIYGPLLSVGGDDALNSPQAQKANRFPPVVKCFGPFFLAGGEQKTLSFVMPRYVGAVKTMVVAGYNGSYGIAEKSSFVKDDLMVLGTVPRVLGPGEKITLPVDVFALNDTVKNVTVRVESEGLLNINGEATKQITFDKAGDQFVYFDLTTPEKIGTAKVMITAESGTRKATYEVALNVRPANPYVSEVKAVLVSPGQSARVPLSQVGVAGTNTQSIEASMLPPVDLTKRLNYLIRYPHGCVEQVTSSVFPQLYLPLVMELDEQQKSAIDVNVKAGIDLLMKFRTTSGGFAYWPGNSTANEWGSNYAGHFLVEACNKGYTVPQSMLNEWSSFQKEAARKWKSDMSDSDDLIQAYRLYTLSLYGDAQIAAMNRMREKKSLNTIVKWRLAAAYAASGRKEIAEELINKVPVQVPAYYNDYDTYGSALRDQAMMLETLYILDSKENGVTLYKEIADQLNSDSWQSTQTTAYCLLSLAKYAEFINKKDVPLMFDYTFVGDAGSVAITKSYIAKTLTPGDGELSITNTGKNPLFVNVVTSGIPLKGKEMDSTNGISLSLVYRDQQGEVMSDITRVKQGTDFTVEATVTNHQAITLNDLALTEIFPSGWEIINTRVQDDTTPTDLDYQDIKDDRVMSYFTLSSGEQKVIKVRINAAYVGSFYMPAIICEAMYNDQIKAVRSGKYVSVIR